MINDCYIADMELELRMMGENPARSWIKAVYSPDELSEEDRAVLDRYFNFGMIQISRLAKVREFGLAEEDLSQRVAYLGWQLGNESGRRWWNQGDEICGDNPERQCLDFVDQVDRVLSDAPSDANQQTLDRMLRAAED